VVTGGRVRHFMAAVVYKDVGQVAIYWRKHKYFETCDVSWASFTQIF
jgi:hypothetical protein